LQILLALLNAAKVRVVSSYPLKFDSCIRMHAINHIRVHGTNVSEQILRDDHLLLDQFRGKAVQMLVLLMLIFDTCSHIIIFSINNI